MPSIADEDAASIANALPLERALDELKMDRSTFYRYCAKGLFAKFIYVGKVYVPRQSIDDYRARLIADALRKQARTARSARARRDG